MRRLYYVADHIDDADAICRAMMNEGVSRWHLHVLAKDEAGLYSHKIHSANPIHQLDIVHTGLRYAGVGLLCGLLAGMIVYALGAMGTFNFAVEPWVVGVFTLLGTCFGAWEGGMVGLTRENYKIERFHEEIEAGKYLLMVDVENDVRPLVKEMMNFDFPHVPYRGAGNTTINPLKSPRRLYHQNTH